MKTSVIFVTLSVALFSLSACNKDKHKSEAAAQHEEWIASLPDSVKFYTAEKERVEAEIVLLHDSVSAMLPKFTFVDDPRQVEGYTILRSWEKDYPLNDTGIIARITKGEEFEIIAALKGSSFSSLQAVSPDGKTAESDTVNYDQALNYKIGNLNIVSFQGKGNDSIADLIADSSNPVTLIFKNPNKVATIKLSPQTQNKFRQTRLLYRTQKEVERLELSIPLMAKKIDILRKKIDSNENSHTSSNVDN